MVPLRFMDPDHVIEQQIMAITGSESLVRQTGPADHDRFKLSDLRMNAKFTCHDRFSSIGNLRRSHVSEQGKRCRRSCCRIAQLLRSNAADFENPSLRGAPMLRATVNGGHRDYYRLMPGISPSK